MACRNSRELQQNTKRLQILKPFQFRTSMVSVILAAPAPHPSASTTLVRALRITPRRHTQTQPSNRRGRRAGTASKQRVLERRSLGVRQMKQRHFAAPVSKSPATASQSELDQSRVYEVPYRVRQVTEEGGRVKIKRNQEASSVVRDRPMTAHEGRFGWRDHVRDLVQALSRCVCA